MNTRIAACSCGQLTATVAGEPARVSVCPNCGSTVYYTIDELPGAVVIPVGAFAEPTFPAPTFSVYEERMHRWVGLPAAVEHMA